MMQKKTQAEKTLEGGRKAPQLIRDLTSGSVPGTMLRFAMPLFLSGLLQMVYNMVDMIVVGQMVGTSGLSAVSIGGEMMMLITFIAMGFSNAGQILISRYVGEKRHDRIGDMVATLFTLLLSLAVLIMILFLLTYQDIMAWLNTPDSIWEYTQQYVITCILGTVFIYGYNLVSAILRGMGDSKHPFMFIAIASVLNLLLDLLFVGPMGMGPRGAALATVIGQAVSFLFALSLLYRHRDQIHFDFRPSHFRICRTVIKPLLSLGIPMVIQSAAITFSMLFVNSYINQYGEVHIAVTGIARKLENMISIVSQAISAAGGAMISQAIGARKTERVPKVVGHALWRHRADHAVPSGMAFRYFLSGPRGTAGRAGAVYTRRNDPVPGLHPAASGFRPDQRLRQFKNEPGCGAPRRSRLPDRSFHPAGNHPGLGNFRLLVRKRHFRLRPVCCRVYLPALRPLEAREPKERGGRFRIGLMLLTDNRNSPDFRFIRCHIHRPLVCIDHLPRRSSGRFFHIFPQRIVHRNR